MHVGEHRYRRRLAKLVGEVCELSNRKTGGPAYRVVKTIFEVITAALRRGESVHIPGFGTFHVVRFKPNRKPFRYTYFWDRPQDSSVVEGEVNQVTVYFRPSKSLKAALKEPTP